MVQVVIVNGRPESGKTTFEQLVREEVIRRSLNGENIYSRILSTVDFVKFIAAECGWDGTKTLKNRKFLSDLKDLLTEWDDVPFKKIKSKIEALADTEYNFIVFVDCREPEEIQKLKDNLNAMTLLIRRLGDENKESSNHADERVFEYKYDYTVRNYGTLDDLAFQARLLVEYMLEREGKKYVFSD